MEVFAKVDNNARNLFKRMTKVRIRVLIYLSRTFTVFHITVLPMIFVGSRFGDESFRVTYVVTTNGPYDFDYATPSCVPALSSHRCSVGAEKVMQGTYG